MSLVSAIPQNLMSYGAATIEMDGRLSQQGSRLQSAIDALNNSAPDPKVLGPLPALGSQLTAYAAGNAAVDAWVGDVGNAFANADQGGAIPGQVVQAQQSVINALSKGEEPQGAAARGAALLRAEEAGKNGFVDLLPAGKATLTWVLQNAWWLTSSWGGLAKGGGGLPVVLALVKGYRLVPSADGKYVIAKGTRYLAKDASFWEKYIESGRLDGTRYSADNADVAKLFSLKTALKSDLKTALNPLSKDFWDASKIGGGAVAEGLTVVGDVWDYGWGDDKKAGFGTKFASALTVDTASTAGTVAVADGASALGSTAAAAALGAEAGSVVPIAGTVTGLIVGAGVGYLMSTGVGKELKEDAVNLVSDGIHDTEKLASGAWKDTKSVAKTVVHDLNPGNWF